MTGEHCHISHCVPYKRFTITRYPFMFCRLVSSPLFEAKRTWKCNGNVYMKDLQNGLDVKIYNL